MQLLPHHNLARRKPLQTPAPRPAPSLERYLANAGVISDQELMQTIMRKTRHEAGSYDIINAMGCISASRLSQYEAERLNLAFVQIDPDQVSKHVLQKLDPKISLRHNILPLNMHDGRRQIACHNPAMFKSLEPMLNASFGPVQCVITCPNQIKMAIINTLGDDLTLRAETRCPESQSCRRLKPIFPLSIAAALFIAFASLAFLAPNALVAIITIVAIICISANSALKLSAAWIFIKRSSLQTPPAPVALLSKPCVSIIIALYKESGSLKQLISALDALEYPKDILDVILVLEEKDSQTIQHVAQMDLPNWLRVLPVPKGGIQTKPRALNYALDHCRGSIIGIYDAEDIPAADQINKVVEEFARKGPDTACLQGVLDIYNTNKSWLTRCFTIEYATWFRIILPGLQKMGLAVPLGGTSLFFRREVLEKLGGCDAHNVTEDADLGMRLARAGYKTEVIDTHTLEEANSAIWPWIRQRSRWLKGYAMTWAVHMRTPRKLLRDFGAWRFCGFQILFLGTILQLLLVPFLWLQWANSLSPVYSPIYSQSAFIIITAVFLASEIITIAVGMLSVAQKKRRNLIKWVPSMHFYFFLAVIAIYKGLLEILYKPFFWDKTQHGICQIAPKAQRLDPPLTRSPNERVAVLRKPRLDVHARLHSQLLHREPKLH